MKSLLECYSEKELVHLFGEMLAETARQEPDERHTHLLANDLRVAITYHSETQEFSLYVGRAYTHPDKETLEVVRLVLGVDEYIDLPAREYFVKGVLHIAPGMRWLDGPRSETCAARLHEMYLVKRPGKALKKKSLENPALVLFS